MKKKLSLLMVALVAIAAFAVQQTRRAAAQTEFDFDTNGLTMFGFTEASSNSSHAADFTETKSYAKDGVTVAISPSGGSTANRIWGSTPALRMYGGTLTVSAPTDKYITNIAISQGKWNDGNSANSGELSSSEWKGSANSVVISIAGNTQFKKITVTVSDEPATAPTVATPTITGTTPFIGSTEVTLACETEGAKIYYTTNGDDPTAESTLYENAFTLTETATVKAIAIKDEATSSIASKTFTAIPSVANIAALNALDNNATFGFTGEALVVAKPTAKYVYVKDATGASLLYDNGGTKFNDVIVGKTINPNWTGKVSIYSGLFEALPDAALTMKDGDPVAVTYPTATAADLTAENMNKVVTLKGVTYVAPEGASKDFSIYEGETQIAGRNNFGLEIAASVEGETYDIVGAIGYYKKNAETEAVIQFQPIEFKSNYSVKIATDIVNGTVEVDKTKAAEGDEVTITATPAEGYKLLSLSVVGDGVDLTVPVSGSKFTMPAANVIVSATFVQPEDITIAPTEGDIYAALKAATTDAGKIAKNITINLTKDAEYTLSSTIKGAANITINGNGSTIDASTGDNIIGIEGVEEFAKNSDETNSDHSFVSAITFKDVTIKGMKKALVRDLMTKTLLETLTIDNCVMQVSDAKPFIDFDSRGYVGKVVVKNSTIWAVAGTNKNFAKYGSRPLGISNAALTQEFDIQNSTIVNIGSKADFSGGQNFNNLKQVGTAQNVYTVKNNIFVNCGKSGQAIVGLNNGQTSATPSWDVDKNAFNWNGADVAAAEVTKAGQKDGVDIVKNSIPGVVAFASETAIADGNFKLANCAQNTAHIGDPRWLDATVEPEPEDIVISPASGDITAALFEATTAINKKAKNITINLAANGAYTVSAPIEAGASVSINGAAGATIDASGLTDAFIKMSSTPAIAKVTSGQYVVTTPAKIENVKITGLTKSVYTDNGIEYAFETFTINNCVFEYETQASYVLDFSKSMAINFNITNSTFYSKTSGTANFISLSGKRPWQITGYEEETGKLTVDHSTFYNLAKSKQFLNTNTLKGQKYLYVMNSNIFVDCSNKKIYGNMTNNAKQVTTDSKNTYMFDGVFFAETGNNGDAGLQTDPYFKDAANGDFAIASNSAQAKAEGGQTGDARWGTYDAGFAIKAVNAEGITITPEVAYAAEGVKVYATYTLAEGYELEIPSFVDDNGDEIALGPNQIGLEEVGGVEKMFIIMPAMNVTIIAKASKKYQITLALSQENGSATCLSVNSEDPSTFFKKEGKEIYLAITPASNYEAEISVMAGETPVEVIAEAGTYSEQAYTHKFIMPASDVTVTVTFKSTVGINSIAADKMKNATIYNMKGQRVDKAQKGLYIINGKKVVIK